MGLFLGIFNQRPSTIFLCVLFIPSTHLHYGVWITVQLDHPLPPSFLGRYISSVDPKWCLPLLWTLTITFLTSLSCSCCRSAIGQTWVHIKYHGRTGSVNWLNARDANFLLLSDGGLVQVTDIPCRRTFAAPFSTRWSSWLIFSITARNLKKDPCFKLCINSEPRGGGGRGWGTPHMKWVGMLVGNFKLNP